MDGVKLYFQLGKIYRRRKQLLTAFKEHAVGRTKAFSLFEKSATAIADG